MRIYLWNEFNVHTQTLELGDNDDIPERSTFVVPPDLVGKQVAYWQGHTSSWEVLQDLPAAALPQVSDYEKAVAGLLDTAAQAEGYDSITNAVSYAEEPANPKFQGDGKRFRKWRSLVWAHCYEQLALVQAGEISQPTVEDFLLGLPQLEILS